MNRAVAATCFVFGVLLSWKSHATGASTDSQRIRDPYNTTQGYWRTWIDLAPIYTFGSTQTECLQNCGALLLDRNYACNDLHPNAIFDGTDGCDCFENFEEYQSWEIHYACNLPIQYCGDTCYDSMEGSAGHAPKCYAAAGTAGYVDVAAVCCNGIWLGGENSSAPAPQCTRR